MPRPQATPFEYQDFRPQRPLAPTRRDAPEPAPPPDVGADIARRLEDAYAAGVADGAKSSAREAESDRIRALQSIAAVLAERCSAFERALGAERARLNAAVRTLLTRLLFADHQAGAREAAIGLIDRLLKASADRSPARLTISATASASLIAELREAIAARGAAEFISIETDAALGPGDCRLAWRGGAAQRAFAAIRNEIRRSLPGSDALKAHEENSK
jgi:flagellar biosynthesis/type III secretory pathway protein FliH